MLLTKTDFHKYRQAPLHLWADQHNRLEQTTPSDFSRHLMTQGQAVEALAQDYLPGYIAARHPGAVVQSQVVAIDGNYYARVDLLVEDPASGDCDFYEIKSSNSVKADHREDVTFQALAVAAGRSLRSVYIVHLNKTYVRDGEVDMASLFTVVDVTDDVADLRPAVEITRAAAWQAATQAAPDGLLGCSKPDECPCPSLCFPGLPEVSIFNLPRLGQKARELQDQGILALADLPSNFPLTLLQDHHRQAALTGQAYVNAAVIRTALGRLPFPLYFLDYESFNAAVPMFDGFAPYQYMVFQYSLHILDAPGGTLRHHEFLACETANPEPPVLASLSQALGPGGTVIVWYKTFEVTRNREMADRQPEYRPFLESINARVYDLMEIFSQGQYVDGNFRGSASLKNVLPAVVPNLDYERLPIREGTQAMLAWFQMAHVEPDAGKRAEIARDLLEYCHLDTLAMVRIWEFLGAL